MKAEGLLLTVRVTGQPAGLLTREAGSYVFNYEPQANSDQFVSLTMPSAQL